MTSVIIIQGGSLETYYEQTMDYLKAKYHTYPSNLPDLPVDPEVMSEMSTYEALARSVARDFANGDYQAGADKLGIPLGKLVI